jgi:midasin (ATPase involved in ribosome maturation)
MLLGGRLRDISERQLISEVINKHFKRDVNVEQLFGFDGGQGGITTRKLLELLLSHSLDEFSHLVWTNEFVQMAVLVYRAVQFNEPVLLVGNTGYVLILIDGNVMKVYVLNIDVERQVFVSFWHVYYKEIYFLSIATCIPRRLTYWEDSGQ